MSEIQRIVDELQREHSGDAWYGSPLLSILEDVTAGQAARKPLASGHSIWELVLHMTAWKSEVTRRLSGAPAGEPPEGDWPSPPKPTEEAWSQAKVRLQDVHDQLVAAVRALPEGRLYEPTNDPRDRPLGVGVPYYVLLHGIVQHDVYHSGQIALLKKAG